MINPHISDIENRAHLLFLMCIRGIFSIPEIIFLAFYYTIDGNLGTFLKRIFADIRLTVCVIKISILRPDIFLLSSEEIEELLGECEW